MSPTNYVVTNVAAITSKCRYPEVAMRYFDYMYNEENGVMQNYGPSDKMPQYLYGMLKGWTIKNNKIDIQNDNPAKYESELFYQNNRVRLQHNTAGLLNDTDAVAMRMYGLNPPPEAFDRTMPDGYMRGSTFDNLSPHIITEFPNIVYWDDATSRRLTDLSSVINDYASIQFAQFVTGARPLSDLNAYYNELDRMGYQEYLKYHVDYYEKVRTDK